MDGVKDTSIYQAVFDAVDQVETSPTPTGPASKTIQPLSDRSPYRSGRVTYRRGRTPAGHGSGARFAAED